MISISAPPATRAEWRDFYIEQFNATQYPQFAHHAMYYMFLIAGLE